MIVVSDSTVLIGLGAIGSLDWLKQLYELVIVPTAVYQEVTVAGAGKPGARAVADFSGSSGLTRSAAGGHRLDLLAAPALMALGPAAAPRLLPCASL